MKSLFVGGMTFMTLQGIINNLDEKLDPAEVARIKSKNIFISVVSNPASEIRYRNNPFKNLDELHLITLDIDFCKKYCFYTGHLEAVILHEIGHIINAPNSRDNELHEFCADDYVRYLSFGQGLLDNLNHEVNNVSDSDRKKLIQKRIERITNDTNPVINFS